ncbi:MAG: peptidylprolyl isomerase [Phycisphaerae bacterium]|jgi:parvulin-like peptidyl-prolyl isomerase|nr:peptidylprolyl isomerase [Phycisphaerae bacterium]
MKIHRIAIVAAILCTITLPGVTEEKPTRKADAPPTTQPAAKVVAMVGKVAITSDKVAQAMRRMRAPSKQQALDRLIMRELIEAYIRAVPCTPKDIEAWKTKMSADLKKNKGGTLDKYMADRKMTEDDIKRMVRIAQIDKKAMKVASPEAIAAFTKANPTFFDGTEVQASHILLSCGQGSSTVKRAEICKQLEQIAADIKGSKVKFADAAGKHSSCPSGKKGGDLGPFAFHKMVPQFSQTAFGMKVGDISGIVETQFGFHLITVTKRTAGKGKPGPYAQQIAKRTLLGNFQDKVVAEARKNNPVTILK